MAYFSHFSGFSMAFIFLTKALNLSKTLLAYLSKFPFFTSNFTASISLVEAKRNSNMLSVCWFETLYQKFAGFYFWAFSI